MIKLSAHAIEMLDMRGIQFAWVQATVERPSATAVDPRDPTLTRSFRAVPEAQGRVSRVVHRPAGPDIMVITAHLDRGARL
ncbi:MAG: DUF4258 domain-containing protein [Caulobacteraceae bacterium]